jgi:hypothetical protein
VEPADGNQGFCRVKDKPVGVLRRHYQALRDYSLFAYQASVLENYMELVIQFGYVILFGQIFPLGALFSMASNEI